MTFLIAVALATSAPVMPWIDRAWLENEARTERVTPRKAAFATGASGSDKAVLANNLRVLGAICRASTQVSNPSSFLGELGGAYSMTRSEISVLRRNCEIYLSGRAGAH
jgi:hypothetical protein